METLQKLAKSKTEVKFYVYSDPGHAWVAVKRQYIEELGLTDKISGFSYQKGQTVYLEEDCDAGKFFEAARALGVVIKQVSRNTNNSSPIRSYPSYR